MYICSDCGYVFEEFDTTEENRGQYWGVDCTETIRVCPKCKGAFEEAEMCQKCGEYSHIDSLHDGICEKCIDECKNNFDICYKISKKDRKQSMDINPLILSIIKEDEIESILVEYIKKHTNPDCSDYINEDISWFGEKLAEEVKKNENSKK